MFHYASALQQPRASAYRFRPSFRPSVKWAEEIRGGQAAVKRRRNAAYVGGFSSRRPFYEKSLNWLHSTPAAMKVAMLNEQTSQRTNYHRSSCRLPHAKASFKRDIVMLAEVAASASSVWGLGRTPRVNLGQITKWSKYFLVHLAQSTIYNMHIYNMFLLLIYHRGGTDCDAITMVPFAFFSLNFLLNCLNIYHSTIIL